MSALVFLGIAVVLSLVGSVIVAIRHRPRTSAHQSIDDFAEHLRALAPERPHDGRQT
jgi:hypothetical protein